MGRLISRLGSWMAFSSLGSLSIDIPYPPSSAEARLFAFCSFFVSPSRFSLQGGSAVPRRRLLCLLCRKRFSYFLTTPLFIGLVQVVVRG